MIYLMNGSIGMNSDSISEAVEAAARHLVAVRRVGDSSFVSLPMYYPDGSSVTVRVRRCEGGVSVSDAGFAYEEVADIGAGRSFGRVAGNLSKLADVEVLGHVIRVHAPMEELERAIYDVASTSWRVADEIFRRAEEVDEDTVAEELRSRLVKVFGAAKLREDHKVVGASTNQWEVSAILDTRGAATVFQAVPNHAVSIYRASTAFRDIADLPNPPKLVAVVRNKVELGPKLTLLSQNARVIELEQSDEEFERAAA
ncbi:MAG: hypothetical protein HQL39_11935 [Alphaproteobacteria bacterium]|nr:hypothetical protein [Alphaproteobacteria bacterium]MBF0374114.1 hypothetical protein [Alphaproteobacteria bacterium]